MTTIEFMPARQELVIPESAIVDGEICNVSYVQDSQL